MSTTQMLSSCKQNTLRELARVGMSLGKILQGKGCGSFIFHFQSLHPASAHISLPGVSNYGSSSEYDDPREHPSGNTRSLPAAGAATSTPGCFLTQPPRCGPFTVCICQTLQGSGAPSHGGDCMLPPLLVCLFQHLPHARGPTCRRAAS